MADPDPVVTAVVNALTTAIGEYSGDATSPFEAARTNVRANANPPDDDQVAQKKLTKAQGALAAAFSQLGSAAKMLSDQEGRNGHTQVVALMTTTATTAESVCHLIRSGTWTAGNLSVLTAYTAVLTALAQLSPAAVWQPPSGGGQS